MDQANSSFGAHVLFLLHASLIEEQLEQRNSSGGDDIIWDRASLKADATQLVMTIKVKLLLQNYY